LRRGARLVLKLYPTVSAPASVTEARSWPLTAAVPTRGNCSRTPSCTCTASCPSVSASSWPRPSPPWIPWPWPGAVPP